ncbi:unnamed protein product, partial [Echinostoma caproni]|uniref:RME-8_N domain-containing protein n=1 Tax=Echinostoma caproni TaxID=27848 RepID=A0A183B9G1_9TREM
VPDLPGGVAIVRTGFSRIHVFTVQHVEAFVSAAFECAQTYLGLSLKRSKVALTRDYCREFRLGNVRYSEARGVKCEDNVPYEEHSRCAVLYMYPQCAAHSSFDGTKRVMPHP